MAHPSQHQFCLKVKGLFPEFFLGQRVLEVGSLNVNGSMRPEFEDCEYIGCDVVAGDGVDIICKGHEFDDNDRSFDVVFSCETFEHDPYAWDTVSHMCKLLRPGGLFFMTCAGVGRGEHGTTKTGEVWGPTPDFYSNVELGEFLKWCGIFDKRGDGDNRWKYVHIEYNDGPKDLYFCGIKAD